MPFRASRCISMLIGRLSTELVLMRIRWFYRVATLTGFEPITPHVQDCAKTQLSFREQAIKRIRGPFTRLQ
jgi:hypothetical protein